MVALARLGYAPRDMVQLSPATLIRLRDRMLERGARPSLLGVEISAAPMAGEAAQVDAQLGPICEAMFLMMTADGRIDDVERDLVRGALRELDPRIRTRHVDAMMDESARRLEREGRAARLTAVAAALDEDPVRGEIAFVLAAAVASVDGQIDASESCLLDELARALGIDEATAAELLDEHVD